MLRVEAVDTATRVFQYKTLNNILYPNKLLFRFQKYEPPYVPFVNYWKTQKIVSECIKTQTHFTSFVLILQ